MHNRDVHPKIHPLQLVLFRTSPDPQPACQQPGSARIDTNLRLRATPAQPHKAACRPACPAQPALSQAGRCVLCFATYLQETNPSSDSKAAAQVRLPQGITDTRTWLQECKRDPKMHLLHSDKTAQQTALQWYGMSGTPVVYCCLTTP